MLAQICSIKITYMGNSEGSPESGAVERIDTIVIGAGIAGMAAASQLAEKGHQVVVLEAESYIGGRLKTRPIQLSNDQVFQYEEGANWIHGSCEDNPITKISGEIQNVGLVETDDDSIVIYNQNKENVTEEVAQEFEQYQKLIEQTEKFEDSSIYDALKKLDGSKLTNPIFMSHVSNDIEFNTGSSINQLSAEYANSDAQFQGKQMLVISGYQNFASYFNDGPNLKVLLSHQVSQVTFDGEKTHVKCSNGKTFVATYMVCAIPMGVLKAKTVNFSPQLPQWKQEAIQKIYFGNVCKILIILKDKPIEHEEHYIVVVPNDTQKRGSATYFLNIQAIAGLPALMTFGIGQNANELEAMPENQLKELIASRLRVFADESYTADDFEIARTSWKANQNFRGAYSSSGVGTKPHHWKNMAKPIFDRRWYFCGEHTHSNHRGTVHGAYESGIDTANVILKNVDEGNWKYTEEADD